MGTRYHLLLKQHDHSWYCSAGKVIPWAHKNSTKALYMFAVHVHVGVCVLTCSKTTVRHDETSYQVFVEIS
jgi:hypothetical protein